MRRLLDDFVHAIVVRERENLDLNHGWSYCEETVGVWRFGDMDGTYFKSSYMTTQAAWYDGMRRPGNLIVEQQWGGAS